MRIRLLSVGKDRSGLYAPAVEEYAKRISRYVKFAVEEVPEARKAAGTPRARDEEAASLLDRIADGERVVLLDERGKEQDSLAFARRVGGLGGGGEGRDARHRRLRRPRRRHPGPRRGDALPLPPHARPPAGPARARRADSTGPSPSCAGSRTTSEFARPGRRLARVWHGEPVSSLENPAGVA